MVLVRTENLEPFGGGFDGNVRLLFGLLRDFEILLGNGAAVVQDLGARELGVREFLVGHGLAIIRKGLGEIGALHAHEKLALLYGVTQARANFHDTPGRQGDHGDTARDVDADHAGNAQFGSSGTVGYGGQREALRMIHRDQGAILFIYHLRRGRVFELGILGRKISGAAGREHGERNRQGGRQAMRLVHGITSRPTAKFIWLAALRKEPTRFR